MVNITAWMLKARPEEELMTEDMGRLVSIRAAYVESTPYSSGGRRPRLSAREPHDQLKSPPPAETL